MNTFFDIGSAVLKWVFIQDNKESPFAFYDNQMAISYLYNIYNANNTNEQYQEDDLSNAEKGYAGYMSLHIALDIIDPAMNQV